MDPGSKLFQDIDKLISNNTTYKKVHTIRLHRVAVNYATNPYNISASGVVHLTDEQIETLCAHLRTIYPAYKFTHDATNLYIDSQRKYEYDNSPVTLADINAARKIYDDRLQTAEETAVAYIMRLFNNAVESTLANHPHRNGVSFSFIKTPSAHIFLKNERQSTQRYSAGVFTLLGERLAEKYPDFRVTVEDTGSSPVITKATLIWDERGEDYTVKHYTKEENIDYSF
jgi:hypothetical protein